MSFADKNSIAVDFGKPFDTKEFPLEVTPLGRWDLRNSNKFIHSNNCRVKTAVMMRSLAKPFLIAAMGVAAVVHIASQVFQTRSFWMSSMENLLIYEKQELSVTLLDDNTRRLKTRNAQEQQEPKFCPGVLQKYFNESQIPYLTKLYRQADEYHNLGGNLLALQEFLDGAIDHTYERLGLDFVMDGDNGKPSNNDGSSGTKQRILDELKRQDVNNRGGYYQRNLPGKFEGLRKGFKEFEDQRFVDVIEPKTTFRWNVAMGPRIEQDSCQGFKILPGPPRKRREDKFICGWDHLANAHRDNNNQQDECNVISIGSNDEWGFERNIAGGSNCSVATFDCTIQKPTHKPPQDQIRFYSKCISDKRSTINGRQFETYAGLLEQANFTSPHVNYLKIDIEGHEYDVLTAIIRHAKANNQLHLLPEQIQIEFHFSSWMHDLPWTLRTRNTGELALFFGMLFREAGYMAVHIQSADPYPSLREVLMLRVFC